MLSIVLLLGSPAHALDFEDLVEAWTHVTMGQGGSDGHDEASGLEIDATGQVVVVGWVDGAVGHDHDGYAVAYAANGTVAWEILQDVGEIGPDRASSEDRFYDLAVEPVSDAVALCGGRGPADLGDPDVRYLVEAYDPAIAPNPPALLWDLEYVDGAVLTSPIQECRGIDWRGGNVVPAGWAEHGVDAGRWYAVRMNEANGFISQAPIVYDFNESIAVPDQALDIASSATTGSFAIVGARGSSGLVGSDQNDSDWHVRYFDSYGVLFWNDTFAGTGLLDDRANAVAMDPVTGDIVVAGWTNKGDDNAAGQDLDWLVVRYAGAGDGAGGASIVWSQTYESAVNASEGATSVTFDDLGDVLVGGWSLDPATGVERWRVGKLAFYDGVEMQEWLGPVHAGDSRVQDLDFRDGKVAMAGYVDDGAGRDFAASVLEPDFDGDSFGDSVDICPNDPLKWADSGVCGCDVPDIDTDYDTVFNCDDACPSDPLKTESAGICGCGVDETDSDGDLTPDCDDNCPDDPDKVDNDVSSGGCGCGSPNIDTDGDDILNCHDACPNTPPGASIDAFGCPTEEDTGGTDTPPTDGATDGGGDDKGGCGCRSTGGGSFALLAGLGALALRRRSRPAAAHERL